MISNYSKRILKLFDVPDSNYESFYDEARYIIFYKICICLSSINLGLILFNLFFGSTAFLSTVAFFAIFEFVLIFIIQRFKTFVFPSYLFAGIQYFKYVTAVYCFESLSFLSYLIWLVIAILTIFMMARRRTALYISFAFLVGTLTMLAYNHYILKKTYSYPSDDEAMILGGNFIFFFIMFIFVCLQNKRIISYTLSNLNATQDALRDQFNLIKSQSEEKTTLLKEIHHRVKNNLQLVSSLLRLQAHSVSSPEAKESLQEAINRIKAMSMVHEKMYQSDDLSGIDLLEYFENLIDDLKMSYRQVYHVKTNFHFEIKDIEMKKIIPISLIFNELYTNSLKHAFTDVVQPEISLSFTYSQDDDFVCMKYCDNGKWKEAVRADSFGVELINDFVSQLDAQLEFSTKPVTSYRIYFKQ